MSGTGGGGEHRAAVATRTRRRQPIESLSALVFTANTSTRSGEAGELTGGCYSSVDMVDGGDRRRGENSGVRLWRGGFGGRIFDGVLTGRGGAPMQCSSGC